jgi:hypothetical protein
MARSGAWWLAQQLDHVLGRALAHESGITSWAQPHMLGEASWRATFSARELVDPRAADFFLLDDSEAALLSARLTPVS